MKETTSKEKVLKKIRKALIHKSDVDYSNVDFESDIYVKSGEPNEITFAQQFTDQNGKFIFCESENECIENIAFLAEENNWNQLLCLEDKLKDLLKKANVPFTDEVSKIKDDNIGITLCESLVARTGSIMISSRQVSGRRLPFYSNTHLVVAYSSQLVYAVKDALKNIREKYESKLPSMISLISGPSRTSDIEKTLVQGAHGPKEVFVFLIDDTIQEN